MKMMSSEDVLVLFIAVKYCKQLDMPGTAEGKK